jgi:NAD(P)-dependent dehydrogenase (short-subunit alcohol dehydrogenase family)
VSEEKPSATVQRAAIVTGGSRGIGRAIAQVLADEGYGLTITARREEGLRDAVQAMRDAGHEVQGVARNLAEEAAAADVVSAHRERFGRLDVLVNNAGVGIGAAADQHQTKHVDMALSINLRAIILLYREAVGLLRDAAAERQQANVINVSSLAGKSGQPWLSVYSATKAAVISYTEAMSKELGSSGIKSTALCPGWVNTDMTDFIKSEVPADQMIRVEDIAEAVRFLLRLSPGCTVPEIVFARPGELGASPL